MAVGTSVVPWPFRATSGGTLVAPAIPVQVACPLLIRQPFTLSRWARSSSIILPACFTRRILVIRPQW